MDAIDNLILNNQYISITSFSDFLRVEFPNIPSPETLSPLDKLVTIPGVFYGAKNESDVMIFCPKRLNSLEVARAIVFIYKDMKLSVKLFKANNITIEEITI